MRMKLLSILMLFLATSLQAQGLKAYYVEMPDTLSPLLTKVNREDFCDFLASNMKAEVKNRLGQKSEMLKLTGNYLQVKLSSVSSYEMKLLPLNDSTDVICVVNSYNGPATDSQVHFYSTEWKELPASHFLTLPLQDEFYLKSQSAETEEEKRVREKADLFLMKAALDADSDTLSFTYTTPDYLDKDAAEKLRLMLRKEPVKRVWKEGKFQ